MMESIYSKDAEYRTPANGIRVHTSDIQMA